MFAHALQQLREDMAGNHPSHAHMAARTVVQFVCTCLRQRVGPFADLLGSGDDDPEPASTPEPAATTAGPAVGYPPSPPAPEESGARLGGGADLSPA